VVAVDILENLPEAGVDAAEVGVGAPAPQRGLADEDAPAGATPEGAVGAAVARQLPEVVMRAVGVVSGSDEERPRAVDRCGRNV
jgi:hypothetical protein